MHRRIGLAVAFLILLPLGGFANAATATLTGAVKTPMSLDQTTLADLPPVSIEISFETSDGKETGTYTGVLLWDLLAKAGLVNDSGKNSSFKHSMMVTGADGYAVAVAIGELDPKLAGKKVLVAYRGSDPSVSFDHLRLLVPGDLHGGRAVKDIVSIDVR